MGCDIHAYAEFKKKYKNEAVQPKWELAGRIFKDKYYRADDTPTLTVFDDGEEYQSNTEYTEHPYQSRNYDLFAILADVRNGRGFAGVDTGDGFIPIDEPRGLPEDVSESYQRLVDRYGDDGHSHSYMTLEDIDNFDWTQTTKHRGWVDSTQYKIFKEKGKPESWSGGVSGGLVKHITNEQMDLIIETEVINDYHYYTQVEWTETYRESAGKDFFESIESIRELLKRDDVLDVRLVYFFDN